MVDMKKTTGWKRLHTRLLFAAILLGSTMLGCENSADLSEDEGSDVVQAETTQGSGTEDIASMVTESSEKQWMVPSYEEIDVSKRDNTVGTLQYTPSDDGTKMTISYEADGVTHRYTVPNRANYVSGPFAGTDDLGRSLYSGETEISLFEGLDETYKVTLYGDSGEHYVGLFYFLWMGEHGDTGAFDMEKILTENEDAADPNCGAWGGVGQMHFFAEPLYGYYYSNDEWVIRKHMELLSNAGVDFLYFDVTNGFPYIDNALTLMEICHELNEQGFDAPQVVFYTHTNPDGVVAELYASIYEKGLYEDTWFKIDGKPVIVAPKSSNIDGFFHTRQDQWPTEASKRNGWPWMDFEWQQRVFRSSEGDKDTISDSVAQHAGTVCFSDSRIYGDRTNRGRSYRGYYDNGKYAGSYDALTDDSYLYGYNFQSQFSRALLEDVKYVLVTGWNEWVAQRQDPALLGGNKVVFIDTCGVEFSRDLEMTRGYYFDNYYMQLAQNIQALKGVVPPVVQDKRQTINVTGNFDQWDAIAVTYRDSKGDTADRRSYGFGDTLYKNETGRNDIIEAKVTNDSEFLYFYVKTAEDITDWDNDSTWMHLYLNTDDDKTGWYGYDYVINALVVDDLTTTLSRCSTKDGSYSFGAEANLRMRVEGCEMMVEVPLSSLGIADYHKIHIDFKWADSKTVIDEMEDFYTDGDAAPLGRLDWVYQTYLE